MRGSRKSGYEVALARAGQMIDVLFVVLGYADDTALGLQDQVLAEHRRPKFPALRRLYETVEGFELVDRQAGNVLVRIGYHDPGSALGIVKQIDLRSFFEAFHGRSGKEDGAIGRG